MFLASPDIFITETARVRVNLVRYIGRRYCYFLQVSTREERPIVSWGPFKSCVPGNTSLEVPWDCYGC